MSSNRSSTRPMTRTPSVRNGPECASHHQHRPTLNRLVLSNDDNDDDTMDLFSNNRRTLYTDHHYRSQDSIKLRRHSLGSALKTGKSGLDDLLSSSSTDSGKHDYDWLLTPPETPQCNEYEEAVSTRKASSMISVSESGRNRNNGGRAKRSSSVTRLSISNKSGPVSSSNIKPKRSSSVSRPSSQSNKSASLLKTSLGLGLGSISGTSSVSSSNIRPKRSSSVTRPSISNSQSNKSNSSILNTSSESVSSYITTSRSRSSHRSSSSTARPSTPTFEKANKTSRPSTPKSTPQRPVNLNSIGVRSTSTPTRRNSTPSISSVSRPSSPAPRVRPMSPQIVVPDYSLEAPPNLRTTLPDRPLSASRARPGVKRTTTSAPIVHPPRRQPSPIAPRGKSTIPKGHTTPPLKASSSDDNTTGFGRTISKKSLDMAIKHMDIRNNTNGPRCLSGSARFPHSIRSTPTKTQPNSNSISISGNSAKIEQDRPGQVTDVEIHESSRYDTILLKEDLNNTNWLHSPDDQESIFDDDGLQPLPEPFSPL